MKTADDFLRFLEREDVASLDAHLLFACRVLAVLRLHEEERALRLSGARHYLERETIATLLREARKRGLLAEPSLCNATSSSSKP